MGGNAQKLTVEAELKGGDQTAKGVEKIGQAEEQLAKQTKRAGDAAGEATGSFTRLLGMLVQLLGVVRLVGWAFGDTYKALRQTYRATRRVTSSLVPLTLGFLKVTGAIRATSVVLKGFAAGGAVVQGVVAITRELRREIEERQRLVGIIKEQSAAMDVLKSKRRDLTAELERAAGRRRTGGFEDADVSRTVATSAIVAQEQFTQLGQGDIVSALGAFGDVEGLSQKDLTNLAILASLGKLDTGEGMSEGERRRYAQVQIQRNQEGIKRFRRTESVQGQGLGDPEFRPRVTERAAEIAAELRTPGRAAGLAREELEKRLMPGSDVEVALMLRQMFGSAKALEEALVGFKNSARPMTTAWNQLRDHVVEIGLQDQPGYGNQLAEWLAIEKNFKKMRLDVWEDMLKVLKALDVEAGISMNAQELVEAARAMKEAAEAMKAAAGGEEGGRGVTVVNHNQNQRIVYPDAAARERQTINGESDRERRKVG